MKPYYTHPKQDKDTTKREREKYKPISLMNLDAKSSIKYWQTTYQKDHTT
jgi:hypothetical protein